MSATNDRTWTFDPDRADGGVIVNQVRSDMPEYRPGTQLDLELVFWGSEMVLLGDTGGTAGSPKSETGFTLGDPYGSETGATAGSPRKDEEHIDRYESVREYTFFAGRYSKNTALDGTVNIMERTPSDAPIDSIIVALEPGAAYPHTPGMWLAIDDVDDQTRFINDTARIMVSATVLARASEYDTRADLKNALGSDL